jgi:hypothetical protein
VIRVLLAGGGQSPLALNPTGHSAEESPLLHSPVLGAKAITPTGVFVEWGAGRPPKRTSGPYLIGPLVVNIPA